MESNKPTEWQAKVVCHVYQGSLRDSVLVATFETEEEARTYTAARRTTNPEAKFYLTFQIVFV